MQTIKCVVSSPCTGLALGLPLFGATPLKWGGPLDNSPPDGVLERNTMDRPDQMTDH